MLDAVVYTLEKMSETDGDLELSVEAFEALQEFYREEHQKLVNELTTATEFDENWQLSQFWYHESTIDTLANIAVKSIDENGKIALVSCPSLYKKIKEICRPETEVTLFEYDKRFEVFGRDYIFYDYNSPLNIPAHLTNSYDLVLADPPFISEECLEKTASTIKFLAKDKIILCTGEVMGDIAKQLLGVKKTSFEPQHTRNLGNQFRCFSNFDIEHNKNSF